MSIILSKNTSHEVPLEQNYLQKHYFVDKNRRTFTGTYYVYTHIEEKKKTYTNIAPIASTLFSETNKNKNTFFFY